MSIDFIGEQLDLPGDSRTSGRFPFAVLDQNLTGAVFTGHVRASGNQGAVAPLAVFNFSSIVVTTETFQGPNGPMTGSVSRFVATISEASMEAMVAIGVNETKRFPYDIHITLGGVKQTIFFGDLVVRAGVTRD